MTKVAEKVFVRGFVKALRRRGAHVQRIEDAYSSHIPDINYAYEGLSMWLEAKSVHIPKRPTTKVHLGWTDGQRLWAEDRRRRGGHAYGLIRISRTEVLVLGHWTEDAPLEELRKQAIFKGTQKEVIECLLTGIRKLDVKHV